MWRPFACQPALFRTIFLVNARGCHFLGSKPVDCQFISFGTSIHTTATLSTCLPCLGSFAPNGFLLASIPPRGNIFLSACSQCSCSFLEPNGFARVKKMYISHLTVLSDMILFFVCLTAIFCFLPPHGAVWFFSLPHGDIKFSSAAVAFDWCFLPSHQCQTTDGSNDEMPSLLSSSPIAILPASWPSISRCCLLLAFLPGSWISAPSAFTPGHSYSFITPGYLPLLIVAYRAEAICCRRA